jgi:hypothetical protein
MVGGDETDNSAFVCSLSDNSIAYLSYIGNSAYIRGLKPGIAYITLKNTNYPDAYAKTILVMVEAKADEECYIILDQRIVKLKPDAKEQATIKAALAGGNALDAQNFIWWADDYSLISVTSITDTARIEPTGASGMTTLHVKHPKAQETADIAIMVSAYESFAFANNSKTIKRGDIAFIPLEVPPSAGKVSIEYSSADSTVCAITGSSSVSMIAGISDGYTTVTAVLKSGTSTIAVANMAVIVTPETVNSAKLSTKSTVLNMEIGSSMTIEAALSGAGIVPTDTYNISWASSDRHAAELLATEQSVTKGKSAYLTAKNAGEAVITVSHPKCDTDLQIWVLIPPQNEMSITLDQTYLELFKDEGAVSVTAVLINAAPADYNTITWTAPKVGGQVIVSVSKANGKTCNIVPRNVGRTTLRAQLPNGKYADCIISVTSAAEIVLETKAIHVNPGYTETIHYSTNPEAAQVSWIAQSGNSTDPGNYFSFYVNEAAKTISVTGIALGNGSLNGYFVSTSGGTTTTIQVFVEYTYEFELKTSGILSAEPRTGTTLTIPFHVYPADLEISASVSDSRKLEVKSISHNKATGSGEVTITALGEKNGLFVTLQAVNPKDKVNTPIIRTQYINLKYQDLTITPVFDMEAGAFSYYDPATNTLYLGDGEQSLFHLDIAEENAELEDLQVFWQSVNGAVADNTAVTNSGHISLAKESNKSDSGEQLWRIGHNLDHLSTDLFYLISKDLFYAVKSQRYSEVTVRDPPTKENPFGGSHIETQIIPTENAAYDASKNQGITGWWVDVH